MPGANCTFPSIQKGILQPQASNLASSLADQIEAFHHGNTSLELLHLRYLIQTTSHISISRRPHIVTSHHMYECDEAVFLTRRRK